MRTTDRGLQKAQKAAPLRAAQQFQLPHDAKIQEESILREKRQEKRIFILFLIFTILSGEAASDFYLEIRNNLHQLLAHL